MSDALERLRAALSDRYRLERELGRGGMATVYLAHDLKHDRDVAIKVLHEDLGATLGPERFLAEIKTTAKLQHPHILPLLDSGEASGLLFYVMPYVAGDTLRDRLTRETQLPIDDAVRIAREVADSDADEVTPDGCQSGVMRGNAGLPVNPHSTLSFGEHKILVKLRHNRLDDLLDHSLCIWI